MSRIKIDVARVWFERPRKKFVKGSVAAQWSDEVTHSDLVVCNEWLNAVAAEPTVVKKTTEASNPSLPQAPSEKAPKPRKVQKF